MACAAASCALAAPPGDHEAAAGFDYCAARADVADAFEFVEAALAEDGQAVTEQQQATLLLMRAGVEITAANREDRACRQAFEKGNKRFERALAKRLRQVQRKEPALPGDEPRLAEAKSRITAQWVRDQAGRLAYLDLRTTDRSGAAFWAQRRATANAVVTDAESTELMRGLLADFDWIDSHRFGGGVAARAWLLVQHADDHPEFQAMALERMAAYLGNGGVSKRNYAYLWDRVAVNTGQLQRYGTQPAADCNADGTLGLRPVESPASLDERRATMDLGPAAVELARMAAERCGRQP